MSRRLPSFLLCLLTLAATGQEIPVDSPPPETRKLLFSTSLLPDGSVLGGLMVPRYDEKLRLVSLLRAEEVTLVDENRLEGRKVVLRSYRPDRQIKLSVHFDRVVLDQELSTIEAFEPVQLGSERLYVVGSGVIAHLDTNRGFLRGPGRIWIKPAPSLAMNLPFPASVPRPAHLNPRPMSMLAGLAIASLPGIAPSVSAAPPKPPTDAEMAAIMEDAASFSERFDQRREQAKVEFANDLRDSAAISEKVADFLASVGTAAGLPDAVKPPPDTAPGAPHDFQPQPEDTLFDFDGGMYFDSAEGAFVLLGNVRVSNPQFKLSGVDELKIFFTPPTEQAAEEPEAAAEEGEETGEPTINFAFDFSAMGEVDRLVATGKVRFTSIPEKPNDSPVDAYAAVLSYKINDGIIVMTGGFPWVQKGNFSSRANKAGETLRIDAKSNQFVASGEWSIRAPIDIKKER